MGRSKRDLSTFTTGQLADKLSDFVEEKRKEGVNQKALAKEIGVSSGSLSNWCNNAKNVTADNIVKLANYFNVSADYLLGLTEVPTSNLDIRDINNKTGLSQNAIAHLMADKTVEDIETTDFISYLVTNSDFPDLVKALKQRNRFLQKEEKARLDLNGEVFGTEMSVLTKLIINDLFWKIVDGYKALPRQIQLDNIKSGSYTAK